MKYQNLINYLQTSPISLARPSTQRSPQCVHVRRALILNEQNSPFPSLYISTIGKFPKAWYPFRTHDLCLAALNGYHMDHFASLSLERQPRRKEKRMYAFGLYCEWAHSQSFWDLWYVRRKSIWGFEDCLSFCTGCCLLYLRRFLSQILGFVFVILNPFSPENYLLFWIHSTFWYPSVQLFYIRYPSFHHSISKSRNAGNISHTPHPHPPWASNQRDSRNLPIYSIHRIWRWRLWCLSESHLYNTPRLNLSSSEYPSRWSEMRRWIVHDDIPERW